MHLNRMLPRYVEALILSSSENSNGVNFFREVVLFRCNQCQPRR